MSTKLYDGLRLVDPDADLMAVVPQVAQAIRPVFHRLRLQIVAEQFASVVDAGRPEGVKDNSMVFFTAQEKWLEHQRAYGSHHTLNDPLRFSIVFGRAASGDLLAYPYAARGAYKDALMETGLFAEYGYWDNTDHPDELTDEEWDAVRDAWCSLESPEGTFGDLPMWQLSNSLEETFTTGLLLDDIPEGALDELVPARKRLRSLMAKALSGDRLKRAVKNGYSPEGVLNASTMHEDWSTAGVALKAVPDDDPMLPPPLPPLTASWADVGPPVVPDASRVLELEKLARRAS